MAINHSMESECGQIAIVLDPTNDVRGWFNKTHFATKQFRL